MPLLPGDRLAEWHSAAWAFAGSSHVQTAQAAAQILVELAGRDEALATTLVGRCFLSDPAGQVTISDERTGPALQLGEVEPRTFLTLLGERLVERASRFAAADLLSLWASRQVRNAHVILDLRAWSCLVTSLLARLAGCCLLWFLTLLSPFFVG